MKSGWVKLNKLTISVLAVDGQFRVPLASSIYPFFRVEGSGIAMFLFILTFVNINSSWFTGTLYCTNQQKSLSERGSLAP